MEELSLIQIEKQIAKYQNDMRLSYRRTIDDALKIGELLIEAKEQLTHGDYLPWCKRQNIKHETSSKYMLLVQYRDKFPNVGNLTEAYNLIESEENQRKRREFEKQTSRIKEYKKTGIKPDGWDDKTDVYRLRKEKKDIEYEERKRQALEKKRKKIEERKKEKQTKTYEENETDKIIKNARETVNQLKEHIKWKEAFLKKMRLTGNNASEPIYDALFEYLIGLDENQRLEACHNIIKFCKNIANELQVKSVK